MLVKAKPRRFPFLSRFSFPAGVKRSSLLLLLMVVLPTGVTSFYYLVIASERYLAQADFIVRNIRGSDSGGGISSLLSTFGIARAEDQSYAVIDYILSRDAVAAIDKKRPLREFFTRPEPDFFSRYPRWWKLPWRKDDFEALYDYYLDMVDAWYSDKGGIITLTVMANTPDNAKLLAELLLRESEALINRMNERANSDLISFAEKQLKRAETMELAAKQKLTDFRNNELTLNPVADLTKILDLIAILTAQLAEVQRQLSEILQGAPSNPTAQSLRGRISALNEQIATEKLKIAGKDSSLAAKVAVYERLTLDESFANQNLSNAFNNLQVAFQNSWRQQLYLEAIFSPIRSDEFHGTKDNKKYRGGIYDKFHSL